MKNNENLSKSMFKYRDGDISRLFCLMLSILVWYLFFPGIYSIDSLTMYFDATLNSFSDIHPIFLPYTLYILFQLGFGLEYLFLLQILLGFLGLQRLITVLAKTSGMSDERQVDWLAVILVFLFFLPMTPFSLYLSTLWTDTWLLISLLWCLSFLLELNVKPEGYMYSRPDILKIVVSYILVLVAVLVRYNALVIFPFTMILLDNVIKQIVPGRAVRVLLFLGPVIVVVLFLTYQHKAMNISRTNPEYASYALDLASMIVYDPMVCTDLYIQSCAQVYREFPDEFIVGNGAIDFTINQGRDKVYRPFMALVLNPRLPSEFKAAVRDHPLVFLKVKTLNYLDYIGPNSNRYFFQDHPAPNELGLEFKHIHPEQTSSWFALANTIKSQPVLRWFSFVHAPWLVLNVLAVLWLFVYSLRSRHVHQFLLLFLVPLSYYSSYLIFFTASEFRFMYPSMFLVQVVLLTLGSVCLFQTLAQRT